MDLIVDFLSCMWEYAKEQITREIGAVADLGTSLHIDYGLEVIHRSFPSYFIDSADVWLTVPAAWDAKGCEIMREAAISAGLVQQFSANDRNWADRLHIITCVYSVRD